MYYQWQLFDINTLVKALARRNFQLSCISYVNISVCLIFFLNLFSLWVVVDGQ